jgi:DNA-binding NtrC family response regulator
MAGAKILIVDDDAHLLEALRELLASAGYEVTSAASAEEALDRCRADTFHVVLCDLHLPGRNGISLIKALREACPSTATVLITAHGTVRAAVTAVKRGAVEYMAKPIKPKRLLALCASLTASPPEFLPNQLLAGERAPARSLAGLQARSQAMLAVFERARVAAAADGPVLLLGEVGSGRERVARAIHARSSRASRPFVAIERPAGVEELCGAERQPGGERQSGRLDEAEGGTLFIAELGDLHGDAQAALLRLLASGRVGRAGARRERAVDVRVVAATAHDPESMVREGRLLGELCYRLSVLTVRVPPLRERPDDVPVLATELLVEAARRHGRAVTMIPAETQRLLAAWSWPGNVSELASVIEEAVIVARGEALEPSLLPPRLHREPAGAEIKIAIGTPMENIEREVILRTLEANQGNKTATAGVLGISRRSIYNKLASYGQ